MSQGWVNLIVLAALVLILAGVVSLFAVAAIRGGGRKKTGAAKPPKVQYRKVKPKTGDMFR